jgi:hypothetical protein
MDLRHISLRSDGYKSLRDFTRSSRIRATSPLDLTVQKSLRDFESSCTSAISVLKLKTHFNFSQSSRSIDKCLLPDQWLMALWLFGLWVFQPFTSYLPLDLTTADTYPPGSNGPDMLRLSSCSCFGSFKFQTRLLMNSRYLTVHARLTDPTSEIHFR